MRSLDQSRHDGDDGICERGTQPFNEARLRTEMEERQVDSFWPASTTADAFEWCWNSYCGPSA